MGDIGNNNGKKGKTPQNNRSGMLFCLIIALVLVMTFFYMMNQFDERTNKKITYNEFITMLEGGNVPEVQVDSDSGRLLILPKKEAQAIPGFTVTYYTGILEDGNKIQERCEAAGVNYSRITVDRANSVLSSILSYVLMFALIYGVMFFVFRIFSKSGGGMMGVGKSNAKVYVEKETGVTFKDVAGQEEAKESLTEMVDFLHNPGKYTRIGAKLPKGALLVGPPGTGKTLLAKAVAGEAKVPFFSLSGSDFVEMFVGVGASRVRDLFKQAQAQAPCIIFIDEVDAIGKSRDSHYGGGNDEREQTLNQLLVEMDGFTKTEGVIVLAASNRPDILDPALLRPGRFDRQIYVGVPDSTERQQILEVHAKGKCLAESVDLHAVAMATSGFTGADLSNLLNEAAILAARDNRPALNMDDLDAAMMKVLAGPEKRNRVKLKRDLYMTAVHEAGHAVAMYSLPTHDPVHQISIIPRGRALGITWTQPMEESTHLTRNEMFERIVGLLGGRVAEALFLGDISTGASNDIDRASKLARDMVARYGMCESLGTVSYTSEDEVFIGRDFERTKSYSEKVAGTIDDEVKQLMDRAYARCETILKRDEEKLKTVVDFLMEHEVMSGAQFADCMDGKPIRNEEKVSLFDNFTAKDE